MTDMSVEEAGAGEWGENVRVRFLRIYFIFIVVLNIPSRAHVSKENFHFMLCILMNNKDLFDSIRSDFSVTGVPSDA